MNLEVLYSELQLIREDIKELRQDVTCYRAFVHGVLWCLGALAAVLGYVGLN